MSSLWNQFESVHHGELFCCTFRVQSTSQAIEELLLPHESQPGGVGLSRVWQQQFFQWAAELIERVKGNRTTSQ